MDDPSNTPFLQILAGLTRLIEKVDNIEKAVKGNGQPGLEQRVRVLEGARYVTQGALWAFTLGGTVLGALAGIIVPIWLKLH